MSKQPEALRLADALDNGCNFYPESSQHFDRELSTAASDAAAELRRLHALNGELLSILKESVKPLHLYRAYGWSDRLRVIDRVEALIAKAEAA